jgi:hypothetical protein
VPTIDMPCPAPQRGELRAVRRAAVHRRDPHRQLDRERPQRVGDLERELARGRQHQRADPLGALLVARDRLGHAVEQRQPERRRLARARARADEHVTALQQVRERDGLDRRGGVEPQPGDRLEEAFVEAEGAEGRGGDGVAAIGVGGGHPPT